MISNLPKSWNKLINNTLKSNNFLDKIIHEYENNKIYPNIENIFKCFKYFELNETKVVILGQDPYYTPNHAHGLAFGVNNTNKIPPSLKNIAKELYNDLNIELKDYTLENWAKQHILLLNTSLTVLENKPGSHIKHWNSLINNIINELNNLNNSIIFVAWGRHAHNKLKNININKHTLIISSHPSPLSCTKKYGIYPAFNNSKPFSKINNILNKKNHNNYDNNYDNNIIW